MNSEASRAAGARLPDAVITAPGQLSDSEYDELVDRFRAAQRTGHVTVLEPSDQTDAATIRAAAAILEARARKRTFLLRVFCGVLKRRADRIASPA